MITVTRVDVCKASLPNYNIIVLLLNVGLAEKVTDLQTVAGQIGQCVTCTNVRLFWNDVKQLNNLTFVHVTKCSV